MKVTRQILHKTKQSFTRIKNQQGLKTDGKRTLIEKHNKMIDINTKIEKDLQLEYSYLVLNTPH